MNANSSSATDERDPQITAALQLLDDVDDSPEFWPALRARLEHEARLGEGADDNLVGDYFDTPNTTRTSSRKGSRRGFALAMAAVVTAVAAATLGPWLSRSHGGPEAADGTRPVVVGSANDATETAGGIMIDSSNWDQFPLLSRRYPPPQAEVLAGHPEADVLVMRQPRPDVEGDSSLDCDSSELVTLVDGQVIKPSEPITTSGSSAIDQLGNRILISDFCDGSLGSTYRILSVDDDGSIADDLTITLLNPLSQTVGTDEVQWHGRAFWAADGQSFHVETVFGDESEGFVTLDVVDGKTLDRTVFADENPGGLTPSLAAVLGDSSVLLANDGQVWLAGADQRIAVRAPLPAAPSPDRSRVAVASRAEGRLLVIDSDGRISLDIDIDGIGHTITWLGSDHLAMTTGLGHIGIVEVATGRRWFHDPADLPAGLSAAQWTSVHTSNGGTSVTASGVILPMAERVGVTAARVSVTLILDLDPEG